MKYVIWRTQDPPWNGPPQDRPAEAAGVRTRKDYDSKIGMSYLEGSATEIVEEFEATSDGEADSHFTIWLDKSEFAKRTHCIDLNNVT